MVFQNFRGKVSQTNLDSFSFLSRPMASFETPMMAPSSREHNCSGNLSSCHSLALHFLISAESTLLQIRFLLFLWSHLRMAQPDHTPWSYSEVKVSHVWLFETPWTIQSMEFSRPEYCSGWPFPSSGKLPNPGAEPRSPALQADYHLSHQESWSYPEIVQTHWWRVCLD